MLRVGLGEHGQPVSGRVRLHPSGVAKVVRATEHLEPDMLHISQSIRSPGEVRTHEAISERLRTIRLQPACFSWRAMPPSTLDPIKNQHRELSALFAFTEMPPGFAEMMMRTMLALGVLGLRSRY